MSPLDPRAIGLRAPVKIKEVRDAQDPTRTDRLKAAHERLVEAVESIVTGEDWQRMVKVSAKFHRCSFNNQLMIYLQCRDATLVAGFRKWNELNRFVRKGEKGIAIFAPCRYKQEIENERGEEATLYSRLCLPHERRC